ncbi:MAG: radical SAM protein [Oscillospiraceae bacterium]|jgi:MoaA/NifB/PqqE/SkfB family radical SAM enzyme|nr:radical SAM protein [Oscillospiraceae bacterium]
MDNINISKNKIIAHFDRMQDIKKNNRCFPVCLEIHPTNACTHACHNCTFSFLQRGTEAHYLDMELVFRVVQNFVECGGKAILWSGGGDPISYMSNNNISGIKDLIEYTNLIGLEQGIYTNGEELNENIISSIIKYCKFIRFSLDAFLPETHEAVHNTRSFNQILENIKKCINMKYITGSNVDIGVSYVIYDNNASDIVHYREFLQTYNVDYLYFKPGVINNITPEQKERQNFALSMLCDVLKEDFIDVRIEIAEDKIRDILNGKNSKMVEKCYMGFLSPVLAADGKLYFCCHSLNKTSFLLGDIVHESLQDIYSRLMLNKFNDFRKCPIDCKGNLINQDIDNLLHLLSNKHLNFL